MNYQRLARRAEALAVKPANFNHAPTVAPITGVNGNGLPSIPTDPYFSLKVDTNALSAPVQIVLFDASQGWQLRHNYAMPLGVVIEGLSAPYQAILNDLAHASSYVDTIKMTVSNDSLATQQYGRAIEVYESSKGSAPRLVHTMHPEMGVTEQQFQKGINTFAVDLIFTNRTSLVYTQEPDLVVNWGFYQKAELGRKQ